MRNRNLPQPFEIDKMRFVECFTAPSLRHFAVLITGWVLMVGVHTIGQVILSTGLHESEHFVRASTVSGESQMVARSGGFSGIPYDRRHPVS